MLNLLDPVGVENLAIFRDDEDPRKFYVLPDEPLIPPDESGNPDFLFIRYINDLGALAEGGDVGAGFVQFRTTLTIDPGRRDRVVAVLRRRLEEEQTAGVTPFGKPITSTEPLLASPVWTTGTVHLSTFGISDTGLVRKATEVVPVDLAGSLAAMLSLQLDDDGAEIFWGAFQHYGEQRIPISVQYDLGYKARVSARMEIHAKHEVIRRQVWNVARPYRLLRLPFVRYVPMDFTGVLTAAAVSDLRLRCAEPVMPMVERAQILDVINKSVASNTITVKIEMDQTAGEDGAKVQELLFNIATGVLSERVIPMLFGGAAPQPGAASEDAGSAARELVALTDGDDGDSTFSLVLDHQTLLERRIFPSGPVQVLLGSPEAVATCFRELRLSDRSLAHSVVIASTAGVDFENDGIASVHVEFIYEHVDERDPERATIRRVADGTLRSATDVVRFAFDMARASDGSHIRSYRYKLGIIYADGTQVASEWAEDSDRSLLLTPEAMGAIRVELVLTAPSALVQSADVELRYQPATGPGFDWSTQLTPEQPRKTWLQPTGERRQPGTRAPMYSFRVHYWIGGARVTLPWRESDDSTLEIGSPFVKVLQFTMRPQGAFDDVADISGDLDYVDSEREYTVTQPFRFTELSAEVPLTVGIFEGGPERATWQARLTRKDGSGVALGPGEAEPGTVWVGTDVDFLTVQILAELVDFEQDVQLAVVQLTYVDEANSIQQSSTFTFSKSDFAPKLWRVARRDRTLDKYDASIRFVAYDRAKSSEQRFSGIRDQVLLLDRAHPGDGTGDGDG
jgi:hypothetical protein